MNNRVFVCSKKNFLNMYDPQRDKMESAVETASKLPADSDIATAQRYEAFYMPVQIYFASTFMLTEGIHGLQRRARNTRNL